MAENGVSIAFKELSQHVAILQTRFLEESSQLGSPATDEPVPRREVSDAFGRLAEDVGRIHAALFSISKRLEELVPPQ
jgi:hypothetical protein